MQRYIVSLATILGLYFEFSFFADFFFNAFGLDSTSPKTEDWILLTLFWYLAVTSIFLVLERIGLQARYGEYLNDFETIEYCPGRHGLSALVRNIGDVKFRFIFNGIYTVFQCLAMLPLIMFMLLIPLVVILIGGGVLVLTVQLITGVSLAAILSPFLYLMDNAWLVVLAVSAVMVELGLVKNVWASSKEM